MSNMNELRHALRKYNNPDLRTYHEDLKSLIQYAPQNADVMLLKAKLNCVRAEMDSRGQRWV